MIIGISSWKVLGFNVLLYLAGLASINRDYIEAMRMDGAGDGTIFFRLIWPLLTPTLMFVLISTVIFTMQQVFTPDRPDDPGRAVQFDHQSVLHGLPI